MRIFLTLPALALAALFGFSASEAQAGRFFGPVNNGADYAYPYPNGSHNSFGFAPCSQCQARHSHRHRLFHRDQGIANDGMSANVLPGYGMPPAYGAPYGYTQMPMVQSPIQTSPFQMTSIAPAPVPVVPAVQSPSCQRCAQSGQALAPAMQSRIAPVPAPMPQGPTTAEPPPADLTGRAPF